MQQDMGKKQQWAVLVSFLFLVYLFAVASLLKPDTAFSEEENRDLAHMPKISLSNILDGTFEKEYETYLSDQFVFRNGWIGVKTSVERAMGKQEVNDIYFAKDGCLIEKHSGVFATEQAEENLAMLARFVTEQQQRIGADRVKAMIAPNTLVVYEEKLPPFVDGSAQRAYLQKVKDTLPEGTFVDLLPTFAEHAGEYVYYRTDHHWTTRGAWYAYCAWADAMGLSHPGWDGYQRETLSDAFFGTVAAKVNVDVGADTIEAWHPLAQSPYVAMWDGQEHDTLYDRSFLEKRNKYGVFFGGNWGLERIRAQVGNGRRLLVVKDSYANCFAPFAIQDFEEIALIDLRYFHESLREYMEQGQFTDILFLYNAAGFAEDVSLSKLFL